MLVKLPLFAVDSATFLRPTSLQIPNESLEADIYALLTRTLSISSDAFYLAFAPDRLSVQVRLRLRGGKGGFGSQLRAQGNKMSSKKRAGNYEACRDLSGQRLRSQKHAKLINEYLEKEPERLSEREKEIREKMERHLEAPNRKVMFNDPQYLKTSRKIVDGTEDAVRALFASDSDSDESGSGSDSEVECSSYEDSEADETNNTEEETEEHINNNTGEHIEHCKEHSSEDFDEKTPL